jgi:hypothetical protein
MKITKPGFYRTYSEEKWNLIYHHGGKWYGHNCSRGNVPEWTDGDNIVGEWPVEPESFEGYVYLTHTGDILAHTQDVLHGDDLQTIHIRITPKHPDPKKRVEVIV